MAEKEAIGLVSGVNTWYEYYKTPTRGINVRKFNGPNQTKRSGTQVSIGTGASLGTSTDNGTILNIISVTTTTIEFEGVLRCSGGGKLVPQITFSAAPGGTNLMKLGSFIELREIGDNTVQTIGTAQ